VNVRELGALLAEMADEHGVPGAALGISQDGQVSVVHTGVADLTSAEPVTAETPFGVGSITKPVTATVILRLTQDGYLVIDHPVAEVVPELLDSPWAREATIRDLLANRSGIPLRNAWEFELTDDSRDALTRCATRIGAEPPTSRFWSYSNMGWALLGRVIEAVTGLSWEEATQRYVLDPIGMEQTTVALTGQAEKRATGHQITPDGPQPVPAWTPRVYCSAGSTLLCTVPDLLRFAAVHLEDPSLAVMRESHADISISGWLDGWGLGWGQFNWVGGPVWGWDGVLPGERMVLRLLPDHKAAMVLATNGSTGRALYRSVFPPLMEELGVAFPSPKVEAQAGADGDLSRFAGEFAWIDRRCLVTASDEDLVIDVDDQQLTASPMGNGVFLVNPENPDNPTVTFGDFDAAGRPNVIYLTLWGMPRV